MGKILSQVMEKMSMNIISISVTVRKHICAAVCMLQYHISCQYCSLHATISYLYCSTAVFQVHVILVLQSAGPSVIGLKAIWLNSLCLTLAPSPSLLQCCLRATLQIQAVPKISLPLEWTHSLLNKNFSSNWDHIHIYPHFGVSPISALVPKTEHFSW